MTRECNIPEAFGPGAAIEISTDPDQLGKALESALTDARLDPVADAGRRFVQAHFTWRAVISDLTLVYLWLTGAAPRPACVIT